MKLPRVMQAKNIAPVLALAQSLGRTRLWLCYMIWVTRKKILSWAWETLGTCWPASHRRQLRPGFTQQQIRPMVFRWERPAVEAPHSTGLEIKPAGTSLEEVTEAAYLSALVAVVYQLWMRLFWYVHFVSNCAQSLQNLTLTKPTMQTNCERGKYTPLTLSTLN
jgi:hypothetical protein